MPSPCEDVLLHHYVLFSCEGAAEGVIVETLLSGGKLITPKAHVVKDPITFKNHTRLRKGPDIANRFLSTDYTLGNHSELVIARIADTNPGPLKLTPLQRNQTITLDFITKPEIEMLAIVNEGAFKSWQTAKQRNRQLKPSEFCMDNLGLGEIKSTTFLESYWKDADRLEWCIRDA